MESHRIEIHVPPCSSSYPIFKDIYAFLHKQGNHIPIHLQKSESLNTIGGGSGTEAEVRGTFFQTFSRYMDNVLTPFSSKNKDTKSMDISSPLYSIHQKQQQRIRIRILLCYFLIRINHIPSIISKGRNYIICFYEMANVQDGFSLRKKRFS